MPKLERVLQIQMYESIFRRKCIWNRLARMELTRCTLDPFTSNGSKHVFLRLDILYLSFCSSFQDTHTHIYGISIYTQLCHFNHIVA